MPVPRILIALLVLPQALNVASAKDIDCASLLPGGAKVAISRAFPAYRLPVSTDNLEEDIEAHRKFGGTDCLGIATGIVKGRNEAVAALIRKVGGSGTLLVVAHKSAAKWQVELLRDWGSSGDKRLYVEALEPGSYQRTPALDGPADEPGELLAYVSRSPGLLSGLTESSGVAYFFNGSKWVHVWVSD